MLMFFFILPLFLLRRVGQEYYFFEFISTWIVLDWLKDLILEFCTVTFDYDSWIGWNLILVNFGVLLASFLLARFARIKMAPFFICKEFSTSKH